MRALRDFGVGKKSIELRIKDEATAVLEEFAKQAHSPFNPNKLLQKAVSNIICSVCFGERWERLSLFLSFYSYDWIMC